MVEQYDTEEFATLSASGEFPSSSNVEAASNIPPVVTKTWFHTGEFVDDGTISHHFKHEYYREPKISDREFHTHLLADSILNNEALRREPTVQEVREACRSLKGSLLRQEIYAKDYSTKTASSLQRLRT